MAVPPGAQAGEGDGGGQAGPRGVGGRVGARAHPEEPLLERHGAAAEPADARPGAGHRVADGDEQAVGAGDQVAAPVDPDLGAGGVDGGEGRLHGGRVAVELQGEALTRSPQVVEGAGGGHHPTGEDDGGVADPLHLFEQVRGEQHGDPELVADAVDELQHAVALHGVEAVGGLVEHHQVGVVGQGLGQLDALALAGGHGADRPAALLAEPHLPQGVAGPVGGLLAGQAVDLGHVAHQVHRLHIGRQQGVFGAVAEPGPHLGTGGGGVQTEHLDGPAIGPGETEDHADEGGLAGAVGPEQSGDAPAHRERGTAEHGGGAPPLHHVGDLDHRSAGGWCGPLRHGRCEGVGHGGNLARGDPGEAAAGWRRAGGGAAAISRR